MAARAAGRITSVRLLLAGVAAGYALSALTSFLIFSSGSAEGARSVMFWLLGSLALAQWGTAAGCAGARSRLHNRTAGALGPPPRCPGHRR
nr:MULTISPECIES: iron chelate uptake ABC transporter family permease subunit [unclassified Arthrobacter]